MYVNTNVAALNAWQNLNNTQQSLTKVLQELSSGNRINSAADDPAGLAISQQMLTQINGMQQAYTDAQSGISLLQTADGAAGQIQNILQSMRSLASEAATATENPTDLSNIQTEMNQYAKEITQITNNTQFNNVNLLGGAYTNQSIQVGANEGQSLSVSLGAADAYTLGVTGLGATDTTGDVADTNQTIAATGLSANATYTLNTTTTAWSVSSLSESSATPVTTIAGSYSGTAADTVTIAVTTNASGTTLASYTDNSQTTSQSLTVNISGTTATVSLAGVTYTLGATGTATITLAPTQTTAYLQDSGGNTVAQSSAVSGPIAQDTSMSVTATGVALTFDSASSLASASGSGQVVSYTPTSTTAAGTETVTWLGGTAGTTTTQALSDTVDISAEGGTAATSYTNGTGNAAAPSGINVSTQANAEAALTKIDDAINNLSNERANIGADQNRLQFAASDLQTSQENLQSARAGITEADMALQMANMTKFQILQQSGVAMLAQANAMPQALLKLLP